MGSSQLKKIAPDLVREGSELDAFVAALEIVRVEVAVPEPGVTLAGENVQLRVLGTPAQERAIGVFNDPDCACTFTVRVPD